MRPFASRLPARFKLTGVRLRSQFVLNSPQPTAIWGRQSEAARAVSVPGALTSTWCISTRDDKDIQANDVR
jgi:hypothetical protein